MGKKLRQVTPKWLNFSGFFPRPEEDPSDSPLKKPGKTKNDGPGDKSFLKQRNYPFDKTSINRLATAHPDLQKLAMTVAQIYPCIVVYGNRSWQRQAELLKEGKTQVGPGYSKHNAFPSYAIDLAPYDRNGKIGWYSMDFVIWWNGKVTAIADILFGQGYIRGGIDWDGDMDPTNNSFRDGVHFEINTPYCTPAPWGSWDSGGMD